MELNNLSASIYADTYRSQRETNFSKYLNTLYSSGDYTAMLEDMVTDGLASKIPLSTDDYQVRDISLTNDWFPDRVIRHCIMVSAHIADGLTACSHFRSHDRFQPLDIGLQFF